VNLLRTRRPGKVELGGLLLPPLRSTNLAAMQTINLFLWRHAEAEDTWPDLARPLTTKGHRDANRVARALAKQLDANSRVVISPAVRTRETAAPLIERAALHLEVDERLAPGARLGEVLDALEAAIASCTGDSPSLVMVGHQPWLGQVARRLLTDGYGDWSVKKASAWWLVRRSRDGSTEWTLRSVLDAELV
jgi:phosphohistidine phosphatase